MIADSSKLKYWFSVEMICEEWPQKFNIDDASLPRSGSASDRVKQIFNQSEFEALPRSG